MSSDYLCVKIAEYLSGLKTEHIMAATLIYQGLEENPWISKNELRSIVNRAVNLVKSSTTMDFERSGRLIQIIPQVSCEILVKNILIHRMMNDAGGSVFLRKRV